MANRNKFLEYFLLSLFFSFSIIGASRFGILSVPEALISKVFSPVRILSTQVFSQSQEQDLKEAATSLKQQKIEADMNALRDQFAVIYPRSQSLLPAKVIGMPSFIPGVTNPEYLIVDRGEEDGVKIGQAVVLFDNLVGQIDKVGKVSSRAILVQNRKVSFTGKTEGGAIGVVRGAEDSMEIGNILLSEDVRRGSTVFSRGDQDLEKQGIPPDLVVGKIVSIEKNPSALFQKAQIKSLVNFTKLNMVFVVIK